MFPTFDPFRLLVISVAGWLCQQQGDAIFGEGSVRRAATEFGVHYYRERNHQGLNNKLICPHPKLGRGGGT